MDATTPSKIGRYLIDRLLGTGAMGMVYLGRDPELDRAIAIKTLRDLGLDADAEKTFMERFRNEARAAARLHHASIVQVYDVGQDERVGPYLVFEYVSGASLKHVLRNRGPLSPGDLMALVDQIGAAIDVAHDAQIIHRDIKPDNILVTEDGRTKLADFGVARVPDAALTREGQFLGTPCYAAPETLMEGTYGRRTDLFSFAAVLYEAACGARAFPGDDAVAVAHKVIHDEPPPASEVARGATVPAQVSAVLARGLSKDPERRFGSAEELGVALAAAYADAGVVLEGGREPSRSVGLARRGPATTGTPHSGLPFVAVIGGGLAVGVALVFAFAFPPGGTEVSDAGRTDGGAERTSSADVGAPRHDDAGGIPIVGPLGGDAGRASADAGGRSLSSHEREEAAKDAIEEALRRIDRGDLVGGRQALERARALDPGNGDLATVEARLGGR